MSDGSWDVQVAVFSALAGGAAPSVSVPVYASAPQDAALPYVDIGESDTTSADVQQRWGVEEDISVHVWTHYGSQRLAKQTISEIRAALHARMLTVDGRDSAFCFVTSSRLFPDAANVALHGIITLRVTHYGPKEG